MNRMILMALIVIAGPMHTAANDAEPAIADLVLVTEDIAAIPLPGRPGCDAISAFSIKHSKPVFRGNTHYSPGRLAADPNGLVALATESNSEVFLYRLFRQLAPGGEWLKGSITGPSFAAFGGIAVQPDASGFLVALAGIHADPPWRPINTKPFHVARFSMPPRAETEAKLDEPKAAISLDALAAEIIITHDGKLAHIVTTDNYVVTVDAATLTRMARDISLPPFSPPQVDYRPNAENYIHASMSHDDRYLVVSGGQAAVVRVADLETRKSWTLGLSGDTNLSGGVALNAGWTNTKVLAVHAGDFIATYRFDPGGPLTELGRLAVDSPLRLDRRAKETGPLTSIAWSTDGRYLIAAVSGTGAAAAAEFKVIEVGLAGRELVPTMDWSACPFNVNLPNDIWTANGYHWPTPSPTPTSTPVPTATVTASATATASGTPTPSPTGTSTRTPSVTAPPTASATMAVVPLALPLVLREHCPTDKQRVDVALVIDASTSMRDERTAAGRSRLDAALASARTFVDALALPRDQAAVVAFNDRAWLEQGLTGRRADLTAALVRIPGGVRQQTRIDLGVQEAHRELVGPRHLAPNRLVMIVLTDGLANPEPASTAVQRAGEAKRDGITLFTVGVGDESELNVDELRAMASEPRYFYRASDAEDLAAIYREIAVELPCPGLRLWGRAWR